MYDVMLYLCKRYRHSYHDIMHWVLKSCCEASRSAFPALLEGGKRMWQEGVGLTVKLRTHWVMTSCKPMTAWFHTTDNPPFSNMV